MSVQARPAFYALRSGGWRDYVTLVHPPYTLWHLSYVALGAGLAADFRWNRFWLVSGAFFLAVGIGAHALDELRGRPLRTQIPRAVLWSLGIGTIAAGAALGVAAAIAFDLWLLVFVALGGFVAVAYNLELFDGAFHGPLWFAASWGAFPVLTGYFTMAGRVRVEAVLAAGYAFLLSLAQQRLSTEVRLVRRRVVEATGVVTLRDGTTQPIDADRLLRGPEAALQALAGATIVLGLALLLLHA